MRTESDANSSPSLSRVVFALVALPSLSQQEDSLHQEDSHIRMGLQPGGSSLTFG